MHARTGLAKVLGVTVALWASPARSSPSGDELVRQARAHEEVREDDVAARRYMEALSIDPDNEDAWLGLGALRTRIGEVAEAERVYGAALHRLPTLVRAIRGRAQARWWLGRHAEAEDDLRAYAVQTKDLDALRQLADWYAGDGRAPAQLATWRMILALSPDDESRKTARRMVVALVIVVDGGDPASSPADPDTTRRALAAMARRVVPRAVGR